MDPPSRTTRLADESFEQQLHALGHQALEALCAYLEGARKARSRVITLRRPADIARELDLGRWMREGGMDLGSFREFLECYLEGTTKLHHPGYVAHQVAAPLPPSSVADLVNGATNNGMAVFEMGPPAVAIELEVIRWMGSKLGWEKAGSGVLTHGGSLANLTAILAARARMDPDAWERGSAGDLALLAPATSHYSIERAAAILGFGRRAVYAIPVDERGVLMEDRLESTLARVQADGRRPLAVVANACATATGLYDPLEAVADFAAKHGIWFHVDGAHGASALISEPYASLMRGAERADSLVWDAHKMLHSSTLCAALLVKEADSLPAAFRQQADYLMDGSHSFGPNLIHRAIECTKAPLGLKLFLNLAVYGERGLADHFARLCERTRQLWELLRRREGFDCPYEPQANILCFRYGEDDELQVRLRRALIDQGRHYLTSATLNGRRYLRVTIMSAATDEAELERMIEAIEAQACSSSADDTSSDPSPATT